MEQEIWKDVVGYEGLYQVSSNGRVKSLSHMKKNAKGYYLSKEKILSQNKTSKGYFLVTLSKGNIRKTFSVHRLVAIAFIPNPYCLEEINHKDENKANNFVDNLEWCDHKYNSSYGNRAKKIRETLINKNHCGEEIFQYTKFGEFVRKFQSCAEAQRITGINNICACANGKMSRVGGYIWVKPPMTYKEWEKNYSGNFREKERIVEKFDKNGNFIEEYRSASDAARKNNLNISNIANCCRGVKNVKTVGGFIWKYKK